MTALAVLSAGSLVPAEVTADFLADFLAAHGDKTDADLLQAIRQTCEDGFGWWIDPELCGLDRPATHMVEIALFGVSGFGMAPIEAVRNWRAAALHVVAA